LHSLFCLHQHRYNTHELSEKPSFLGLPDLLHAQQTGKSLRLKKTCGERKEIKMV
jgi:hypothetical protein